MKKLYIEKGNINKIVLTSNGNLEDLYLENYKDNIQVGDIIVGIIKNKVSEFNGLFIDIGDEKNAFMEIKGNYDKYIIGKEILIEVLYKDNSDKGFKVTDKISVAGENVVLFLGDGIAYSRKLDSEKFIKKFGRFSKLSNYRILFRQNSLYKEKKSLEDEIRMLKNLLDKTIEKSKTVKGPVKLYESKSSMDMIIRKNYETLNKIYTNSETVEKKLKEAYDLNISYDKNNTLLNFGLEETIQSLLKKKVDLDDGLNIVIEKTEAMHVIDVNSGEFTYSNKIRVDEEEFALKINKKAAKEIVKQIKLRNLSGIIVIDFLSMKYNKSKKEILKIMNNLTLKDNSSIKVYPLSRNSLMEIVREKRGEEIYDILTYTFHYNNVLLEKNYLVSLIISYINKNLEQIKTENKIKYIIDLNFLYKKSLNEIKDLLEKEILEKRMNENNLFVYEINLKEDIEYYDIKFVY